MVDIERTIELLQKLNEDLSFIVSEANYAAVVPGAVGQAGRGIAKTANHDLTLVRTMLHHLKENSEVAA